MSRLHYRQAEADVTENHVTDWIDPVRIQKCSRIALLCSLFYITASHAEVVFDGSIGSVASGTTRSGNFEITEADGQLSGNNLFQSFQTLNVNSGESATFSHSTNGVQNIIGRVSGNTTTQIQGSVAVRQQLNGSQLPTNAVLWLINPNGIVIQDGAVFDANSSFRLATANQIDFANGDAFYSHEVSRSSTLSVANPVAFGFLVDQSLPETVTPGGIEIQIDDPTDQNAPLFLSDMILVGSSVDASQPGVRITGDLLGVFDPNSFFAPTDSSQIQAFRLGVYAMAAGDGLNLDSTSATPGLLTGSEIQILNSNILVTDSGLAVPSELRLSGGAVTIENSFVQTQSNNATSDITIDAVQSVSLTNTALKTATVSTTEAGSLVISAAAISSNSSLLGSQVDNFGIPLGNSGNVSLQADQLLLQNSGVISVGTNTSANPGSVELAVGSGGAQLIDTSLSSVSNDTGAGGDLVIRAESDISIMSSAVGGSSIETNTAGSEHSGDIRITADGTIVFAGNHLLNTLTTAAGDAGDIEISADNLVIAGDSRRTQIFSSSFGSGQAGTVNLSAANDLVAVSTDISSASDINGSAGSVEMMAANITLDDVNLFTTTSSIDATDSPAVISIRADNEIQVVSSLLQSNSRGAAPAGRIELASGGSINLNNANIQSASTASGRAGDIVINAASDLLLQGEEALVLTNSTGSSDAGNIQFSAGNIEILDDATLQTTSLGSGDAGTILMQGNRFYISDSRIESASVNAGGGDIDIHSQEIILNGDTGNIVFLFADSFSSDAQGNGGSITLGDPGNPADLIVVRSSALSASANQGSGGRININSDSFIRDTGSVFLVTSQSGEAGALEINAPEQDISAAILELDVPMLDQSSLIQNVCDRSSDERSSLVLVPVSDLQIAPDGYFPSTSPPAIESPPEENSSAVAPPESMPMQLALLNLRCKP
ncbi:MAG: filamentous hemagglutinin N-terminal domain-containing protein [Candidatus Thiodiazotropha sp. (ex. Lucinisca nassula)]|nr:filamentous hemagglutinin N-terminal domain-containing protein [Candidatus Thiodiazotropha sp. (ex. Lucinisca nassula)]